MVDIIVFFMFLDGREQFKGKYGLAIWFQSLNSIDNIW